jgi:hypothetical protein
MRVVENGFEERPVTIMVVTEGKSFGQVSWGNSPDAMAESASLGTGTGGGTARATTALEARAYESVPCRRRSKVMP